MSSIKISANSEAKTDSFNKNLRDKSKVLAEEKNFVLVKWIDEDKLSVLSIKNVNKKLNAKDDITVGRE